MTLIIEARLEGEGVDPINAPTPLAVIDRRDDVLDLLCALAVCQCPRK